MVAVIILHRFNGMTDNTKQLLMKISSTAAKKSATSEHTTINRPLSTIPTSYATLCTAIAAAVINLTAKQFRVMAKCVRNPDEIEMSASIGAGRLNLATPANKKAS